MLAIHTNRQNLSGGWHACSFARVTPAIQCANSDGGRYRSGDLVQCGPALSDKRS